MSFSRDIVCLLALSILLGCGTTRAKQATDQMLLSDAVDRSVARIDFAPLHGEKVYLDTTYVRQVKGDGFVNSDYIVSSLRQQMVQAGCLLQEDREDADYIAEARVGALGADGHDVNYGVQGAPGISAAASLVGGSIPLPNLPEISLARKTKDSAAAKIAVFAYHRESRHPVWQSGLSVARSSAQARWLLGAGPFQSGSIYEGTQFAGASLTPTRLPGKKADIDQFADSEYRSPALWDKSLQDKLIRPEASQIADEPDPAENDVQPVDYEESP